MFKVKHALLAAGLLALMNAGEARANGYESSCFTQRSGAGYVKMCANNNGGFEFKIRDNDQPDFGWADRVRYVRPAYAVPYTTVVYPYYGPHGYVKKWRKPYYYHDHGRHDDRHDHDDDHDRDRGRHH